MGLKMTTNPAMFERRLSQTGDRAVKGMSAKMRKAAIRIRDLAREYAPVKSGLLESSIDYITVKEGRRNAYVVFVDLDVSKPISRGEWRNLSEYVALADALRPHGGGTQRISAKSRRKGKKVGGKFLTRATRDGLKGMLGELAKEVRRATRSTGQSSAGVSRSADTYMDDEDY